MALSCGTLAGTANASTMESRNGHFAHQSDRAPAALLCRYACSINASIACILVTLAVHVLSGPLRRRGSFIRVPVSGPARPFQPVRSFPLIPCGVAPPAQLFYKLLQTCTLHTSRPHDLTGRNTGRKSTFSIHWDVRGLLSRKRNRSYLAS